MKAPKTYAQFNELVRQFRKDFLERSLRANGGNVIKTAKAIGLDRAHLYTRIHEDGLSHWIAKPPGTRGNEAWRALKALKS